MGTGGAGISLWGTQVITTVSEAPFAQLTLLSRGKSYRKNIDNFCVSPGFVTPFAANQYSTGDF